MLDALGFIERRNRLGSHDLATAGSHRPIWDGDAFGYCRGLHHELDHGAAEVLFADDAVSAPILICLHNRSAPFARRSLHGAIFEYDSHAVMAKAGHADADLVSGRVIDIVGAGRIDGHDDADKALKVQFDVVGDALLLDQLIRPESSLASLAKLAFEEALAL